MQKTKSDDIPRNTNPESIQAFKLSFWELNCVDAEQMWWYIRDGILKKTGIGMILDMRLEITLPRNAAAHPIYVEFL